MKGWNLGDSLKMKTCDHKFVDSKVCVKCSWSPKSNQPVQSSWDTFRGVDLASGASDWWELDPGYHEMGH